ncbi:MAG: hypothetical protein ABJE10_04980, partial [bacterium]
MDGRANGAGIEVPGVADRGGGFAGEAADGPGIAFTCVVGREGVSVDGRGTIGLGTIGVALKLLGIGVLGVGARGAKGTAGTATIGVGIDVLGGGGAAGAGVIACTAAAVVGVGIRGASADAVVAAVLADGADAAANSLCASAPAAIVITPPHTEQRARTLAAASFAGSTRNTERHSGQVTFIDDLPPSRRAWGPRC